MPSTMGHKGRDGGHGLHLSSPRVEPPTEIKGTLPDMARFAAALLPHAPTHRSVRRLYPLLAALDPMAPLSAQMHVLEALCHWVSGGPKIPPAPDAVPLSDEHTRLMVLIRALESVEDWRIPFQRMCTRIASNPSLVSLLATAGLPGDHDLLSETMDRLARKILPASSDETDLGEFLLRLLPRGRDVAWVALLSGDSFARLVGVMGFGPGAPAREVLRRSTIDAALLLSTRISALGLGRDLRDRSPETDVRTSPFFLLIKQAEGLAATDESERATALVSIGKGLDDCARALEIARGTLEHTGVSVDLVYRIESILQYSSRLRRLATVLCAPDEVTSLQRNHELVVRLGYDRQRDTRLRELVHDNTRLLARKIIERAGHTGEKYITSTRAEFFKMGMSAAGGGALTALTVLGKYWSASLHTAPFVLGALYSLNYATSFVVMQLLGLTLATKQPSVVAAALAHALRDQSRESAEGILSLTARIVRSQAIAVAGNLGMVIPTCLVLDAYWRSTRQRSLLSLDDAHHTIESLSLTTSATVFYAALTGVLLWLASVAAGWVENWAVYRKLPEAIAAHPAGSIFGKKTMHRIGEWFRHHISGLAGNVFLGVSLGMLPIFAKFFGLPLDVRHVTLSTGSLTLAFRALGTEHLTVWGVANAALGVLVIGLMNFGVSFALALGVALRAVGVEGKDRRVLLVDILERIRRAPGEFFFPPKTSS